MVEGRSKARRGRVQVPSTYEFMEDDKNDIYLLEFGSDFRFSVYIHVGGKLW
jgi:hypothetical protein